jgi:hypothetical protein
MLRMRIQGFDEAHSRPRNVLTADAHFEFSRSPAIGLQAPREREKISANVYEHHVNRTVHNA